VHLESQLLQIYKICEIRNESAKKVILPRDRIIHVMYKVYFSCVACLNKLSSFEQDGHSHE
jgi:hypothetical protein